MGGHAMKNYGVERLTKKQYDEVLSALTITLPYKTAAIPSYRVKDSFGDCDLLTTATDEAFEESLSKDFTFLGKKKNEKSVENYLKSLSKESLTMLAQPYRDQINQDINKAVESYLADKDKELELEKIEENKRESAEQAFKKECEDLLYSAMPKNLTKKDCHAG